MSANVIPLTQNVNKLIARKNSGRSGIRIKMIGEGTDEVKLRLGEPIPAADVVEVHQVTFGGALPAAGNWKLSFNGQLTSAFTSISNAAAIQTAVRLIDGLGAVTVTGSYFAGFTITMTGAPMRTKVEVVEQSLTTNNIPMTQVLSFDNLPNEGEFFLVLRQNVSAPGGTPYFKDQVSGPFFPTVDAATLQVALRRLYNDKTLTVAGDFENDFTVSHSVDSVGIPLLITNRLKSVLQWAQQLITFDALADGGAFTLDYGLTETASISFDDTAEDVQAALRAIAGLEDVTVEGDFVEGFLVEFINVETPDTLAENANTLVDGVTPVAITVDVEIEYFPDAVVASSVAVTQARVTPREVVASAAVTVVGDNTEAGRILTQRGADEEPITIEFSGFEAQQDIYALTDATGIELRITEF